MAYRRTPATQERLDAARAALVAHATQAIAEVGYTHTTMAQVAERAGVATGTVYQHFNNKAALFTEVFRQATQREVDAVRACLAAPGSTAERVARAVQTFAARARANPRLAYALVAEPVHPDVEAERLRFRQEYRSLFAVQIEDGVSTGELPAQDALVTAAVIVGALAEALVVPLHNAHVTDALIDQLTHTLVRALGAAS